MKSKRFRLSRIWYDLGKKNKLSPRRGPYDDMLRGVVPNVDISCNALGEWQVIDPWELKKLYRAASLDKVVIDVPFIRRIFERTEEVFDTFYFDDLIWQAAREAALNCDYFFALLPEKLDLKFGHKSRVQYPGMRSVGLAKTPEELIRNVVENRFGEPTWFGPEHYFLQDKRLNSLLEEMIVGDKVTARLVISDYLDEKFDAGDLSALLRRIL